jgi:putative membrane protein
MKGVFFKGLLMGIADLVPGISGGSIALILGIYEKLLNSIKTLDKKALSFLFKGQLSSFFSYVEWKFLLYLFLGIITSFVIFSHFFNFMFKNHLGKVCLFSFFLGSMISATLSLLKNVSWNFTHIFFLILGVTLTFFLTSYKNLDVILFQDTLFSPFLIISGCLAICAMLLPGISGSSMLVILGVYIPALDNLTLFLQNLKHLVIAKEQMFFLFNLIIGMVIGIVLFSRIILFFMKRFKVKMLSFIIGLMFGSCISIWPFYSTRTSKLSILNMTLPSILSIDFLLFIAFAYLGFFLFNKLKKLQQLNKYEKN